MTQSGQLVLIWLLMVGIQFGSLNVLIGTLTKGVLGTSGTVYMAFRDTR